MEPLLKGLHKAKVFRNPISKCQILQPIHEEKLDRADEKVKWVLYVREDYQHIDTNNLLE